MIKQLKYLLNIKRFAQTPFPPNLEEAIKELTDGSYVELGFLNILENEGINAISPFSGNTIAIVTESGRYLRIRKSGLPIGAKRASTENNNLWNMLNGDLQEIRLAETFWVRLAIDKEALAQLSKTYDVDGNIKKRFKKSGEKTLAKELAAISVSNIAETIKAKFNAVVIEAIKSSTSKSNVAIDVDALLTPATGFQDLSQEKVLRAQIKLAYAIALKEKSLSQYQLGTSALNYKGLIDPRLQIILNLFYRNYGGPQNENMKERLTSNMFQSVNFKAHPFYDQLVNKKGDPSKSMDENKKNGVLFDIDNDYDFTNVLGHVFHEQAALLAINFSDVSMLPDPDTGNLKVVVRLDYACSLIREDLIIQINKGSSSDQSTYDDELKSLIGFIKGLDIVAAESTTISTPLLTAIKTYTGPKTTIDLAKILINQTAPINAEKVSESTDAYGSINVPVVTGKKANADNDVPIEFKYKNA